MGNLHDFRLRQVEQGLDTLMKTREQVYGREAAAILRDISMYRVLTAEQILRLHPGKDAKERNKIRNLLTYLVKQQRAWLSEDERFYLAAPDALEDMDRGLFAAVWVLADFAPRKIVLAPYKNRTAEPPQLLPRRFSAYGPYKKRIKK